MHSSSNEDIAPLLPSYLAALISDCWIGLCYLASYYDRYPFLRYDLLDYCQHVLQGIYSYGCWLLTNVHPRISPWNRVLWCYGSTTLYGLDERTDIHASYPDHVPILLCVPSLWNNAHMFDCLQEHGMAHDGLQQSIRVILLDWGRPNALEHTMTIERYVWRLCDAILAIQAFYPNAPLIVFGHALGSTLTLAASLLVPPSTLNGLILCATPWDMDPIIEHWHDSTSCAQSGWFAMIERIFSGLNPTESFCMHALAWWMHRKNPSTIYRKFYDLYRNLLLCSHSDHDGHAIVKQFDAVEYWRHHGSSMPIVTMRSLWSVWVKQRALVDGTWTIGSTPIIAKSCEYPVLCVHGVEDKIVPMASMLPLIDALPKRHFVALQTDHFGCFFGDHRRILSEHVIQFTKRYT